MMTWHDEVRQEPSRDDIDQMEGPVLVEFGATWCEHCQALAPELARLLEDHTAVQHIKVEDGPGRPLGRSFRVKLWPTLVFMKDGMAVNQVSRPEVEEVRQGLEAISGASSPQADYAGRAEDTSSRG